MAGAGVDPRVLNRFGGNGCRLVASAELLERFLIVLVILSSRLYIIEKTGLGFGRHAIHTQVEAKGRVRPSIRPGTSQSGCRILCNQSHGVLSS